MAKHGVVRTDKMFGTDNRIGLVSGKYMGAGTAAAAIDNGNVVKLDGLFKDGSVDDAVAEREIYKAVTPAKNDSIDDIVLVATPEVMYDQRLKGLDDFFNEAGVPFRGYRFHKGDIFSVTADCLTGVDDDTEVGFLVELQAGTKLNVAEEASEGATKVGEIIEIAKAGLFTYYAIEIK